MRLAKKSSYIVLALSLLFAIAVCLAPPTASAQSAWRVDREHSIAHLSLGADAQAVEAGIARVDGTAILNPADPTGARLNLTISPDDPYAPQYSRITFQSTRAWLNQDGSLSVAGNLSVTRIVRPVQADANEGYHGFEYGLPIAYTNTSEATIVIPDMKSAQREERAIRLVASTTVHGEDFPVLRTALQSGDWPSSLVQDRQSIAPSTTGEDYAGFESTGTPVYTATSSVPVGSGEGYNGFQPAPDTRNATIALDLKLTRPANSDSGAILATGN